MTDAGPESIDAMGIGGNADSSTRGKTMCRNSQGTLAPSTPSSWAWFYDKSQCAGSPFHVFWPCCIQESTTGLTGGSEGRCWLWVFSTWSCSSNNHRIQGCLKGRREPPKGFPASTIGALLLGSHPEIVLLQSCPKMTLKALYNRITTGNHFTPAVLRCSLSIIERQIYSI